MHVSFQNGVDAEPILIDIGNRDPKSQAVLDDVAREYGTVPDAAAWSGATPVHLVSAPKPRRAGHYVEDDDGKPIAGGSEPMSEDAAHALVTRLGRGRVVRENGKED
jgi:hypothetical protein